MQQLADAVAENGVGPQLQGALAAHLASFVPTAPDIFAAHALMFAVGASIYTSQVRAAFFFQHGGHTHSS